MDRHKRSLGINLLGWSVVAGNGLLLIFHYPVESLDPSYTPSKIISFLSTIAVFPLDFYHAYLREFWLAQCSWLLVMMFCGLGILLLNRFARNVFIVLNIIHVTILSSITILQFGHGHKIFLDYFFKLYFGLVACGTYVGFLTIPEVREQFRIDLEEIKLKWWFLKTSLRKNSPQDPSSYYNLGLAYSRLARYDDAVAALEKAIAMNPENDNFHYHLGMAHFYQKRYGEALAALKETVRINPCYAQAHDQIGMICQLQGCTKEAVAHLERARDLHPDEAGILRRLGEGYMVTGRFEDALKSFRQVVRLTPEDGEAFYQMGRILMQDKSKAGEAQEAFKTALRLDPGKAEAHFQMGMLALKANRYKDALRAFKEVIRLEETHQQAHYHLGFSYAMLNDFESARREYRFLKERDPDLAGNLAMLLK